MSERERDYMPLGLRVLDEQLVDSEGRRCGRVEDLELGGGPGQTAHVVAVLCGATAWKRRLPRWLADLFPGDPRQLRRVPWNQVQTAASEVQLDRPETELTRASDTDSGALALSQLLSAKVIGPRGDKRGRVHDVVATRRAHSDEPWAVHCLLVGRHALAPRIGFSPAATRALYEGEMPNDVIKWSDVERIDENGSLIVRR